MNEAPQDVTRTVVLDGDLTDARNGTRCDGAHQMGYRARRFLGRFFSACPFTDKIVALIEYRDGALIDVLREVMPVNGY